MPKAAPSDWLSNSQRVNLCGELHELDHGVYSVLLYNNSGYNTNYSGYIWLYDGIITYIYIMEIYIWLVAFRHPSEKYEFVSLDNYSIGK